MPVAPGIHQGPNAQLQGLLMCPVAALRRSVRARWSAALGLHLFQGVSFVGAPVR